MRRRVERFPSERSAHEAHDLDNDAFRVVPTGTMEAASREGANRPGRASPEIPPQPRRTGMRSPPIGRMTAWGSRRRYPVSGPPPVEEPQGPGSEASSSSEDPPDSFG